MSLNNPYRSIGDLPRIVPLFPLEGALLLPRGQLPLNVFEPRYLAMVDAALSGSRIIGMVQPSGSDDLVLRKVGCLGRITQFAETGDGRYLITLTGIARFRLREEMPSRALYREAEIDCTEFAGDLVPRNGEDDVDRGSVVNALRKFADVSHIKVDWKAIDEAPNEALVNALSMMCPFGSNEKQALLEAPDLKTRAEVLVAITEIELARGKGSASTLQ